MKNKIVFVLLVIFIGIFVGFKFNQTQEMVDGKPSDEIAPIVVLKAFDAMTTQVENGEVISEVECWGTKSNKIDCKGIGNSLHTASFISTKVMPELKIKGQRGFDGKLQLITLAGVPNKLTPTEANELVTMFNKSVRQ